MHYGATVQTWEKENDFVQSCSQLLPRILYGMIEHRQKCLIYLHIFVADYGNLFCKQPYNRYKDAEVQMGQGLLQLRYLFT